MNWTTRLSKRAVRQIKKLPANHQRQVRAKLKELSTDPSRHDGSVQSGRFEGLLKKRSGRYRIVFNLDFDHEIIDIAEIVLRNEKTYR